MDPGEIYLILYSFSVALVIVCQGLCAVRLAKSEERKVWVPMAAGAFMFAFSAIFLCFAVYGFLYNPPWREFWHSDTVIHIIYSGHIIGPVAFFTGLVFHCTAVPNLRGRIEQLEKIIDAQNRQNESQQKAAMGIAGRKLMP